MDIHQTNTRFVRRKGKGRSGHRFVRGTAAESARCVLDAEGIWNIELIGKPCCVFDRYTDKDPLCCPSRISEGTFEIRYEGGKPVVMLTGIRTRRT